MPVLQLSDSDFKSQVLDSDVPALVDFYTTWCGPCKILAPIVEEIAKDYDGKLKVAKVNVEEAASVATKYSIMSVPTIIIFKKGQVVEQISGVVSKSVLKKKVDAIIS